MSKTKRNIKERVWCIAYINSNSLHLIEDDLSIKEEYKGIKPYIPTVKILKKVFKGKNEFDYVPLLFNYGFFKIPMYQALNPEFLIELKNNINCIYSWVRDITKPQEIPIWDKKKKEILYHKPLITVAVATDGEIQRVIKSQNELTIFSKEDLKNITEGSVITLHGYPFDDIEAEILDINHSKEEVKVKLVTFQVQREIVVSFDNVFYTIYSGGYDEKLKERSLDEIQEKNKGRIDKLMYNPIQP